jgi:hypothetical protein
MALQAGGIAASGLDGLAGSGEVKHVPKNLGIL